MFKGHQDDPLEAVEADPRDGVDFFRRFDLPSLRRMTDEEARARVDPLQVIRRARSLGLVEQMMFTPELRWKAIYNAQLRGLARARDRAGSVPFEGTRVSELNRFLAETGAPAVHVVSRELEADETLRVPSRTTLVGAGTLLSARSPRDAAIEVDNGVGVRVANFEVTGPFRVGIFVKNGSSIALDGNRIHEVEGRGIVILGKVADLVLTRNHACRNGRGGLFLRGDIGPGLVEGNDFSGNHGTSNWMAGVVLTSVPVKDLDDPEEGFFPGSHFPHPIRVQDKLDAPHELVLRQNRVGRNDSSGIYCDGAYLIYMIENVVRDNDKEGVCLDYGALASYLRGNQIAGNGGRGRQTDEDLKADFVHHFGRMEDGSAKAKLPGISVDNAAYNIISGNTLAGNFGSGIKLVRTGVRNLIDHNLILDNNRGKNEGFHFFGIELGNAPADVPADDLDFAPDLENLVFRNMIDGGHYAGIFLAEGCYRNDLFDNQIFGAERFSIESLSMEHNPTLSNLSNLESRGIPLDAARAVPDVPPGPPEAREPGPQPPRRSQGRYARAIVRCGRRVRSWYRSARGSVVHAN